MGAVCFTGCKNEEPKTFAISIQQSEYGVATVSVSSAKAGEEIVVRYYPNSGHKLVTATANDAAIVDGKFKMPKANVVVKPYFQPIDENEISLKVGSYVCAAVGYDGSHSTSVSEWYNIITVNNDKTIDVKAWINDYYVTLTNVNVVREGNVFNVNMTGINAKVYILDENTLVCQYFGNYLNTIVFHYTENVDVYDISGTHLFYINEREEYWNVRINNDLTIKIEMKENFASNAYNTIVGTFKLYGNRMEITSTDNSVFLAVLDLYSYNTTNYLEIGKIGQVVPDENDGEGQDFKEIACDYWHSVTLN